MEKPRFGWRYDKTSMNKLINENRKIWPDSKEGRPRKKTFLYELKSEFTGFSRLYGENIYTRDGTADVTIYLNLMCFEFS
jgi:adenine-specific DNA-methyltransferase